MATEKLIAGDDIDENSMVYVGDDGKAYQASKWLKGTPAWGPTPQKPLLVVRYEVGNRESAIRASRTADDIKQLGYDALVTADDIEVLSPHGYPQVIYGTSKSKPPTKEEMEVVLKAARESVDITIPREVELNSRLMREVKIFEDNDPNLPVLVKGVDCPIHFWSISEAPERPFCGYSSGMVTNLKDLVTCQTCLQMLEVGRSEIK